MKTVYKYPIEISNLQHVEMPVNAEIIHVGLDPQLVPCIWAAIETNNEVENVKVCVLGTGHRINALATKFAGSFIQGNFVWHVFYY